MNLKQKREIKVKTAKIVRSFKYAFVGFLTSLKEERNMKIHILIMLFVILAGIFFRISKIEWIICVILFGVVIGGELFNTAIEATVDIAMPHKDPRAKVAKDVSASAVLFLSISAATVGLMIFLPKVIELLKYLRNLK